MCVCGKIMTLNHSTNGSFVGKHKWISLYIIKKKGIKSLLSFCTAMDKMAPILRIKSIILAIGYRVIALDTRGHGKSPRGTGPFTIERFARDLYDFMADLSISKAVILGFSDGANIAMTFTMKYPD